MIDSTTNPQITKVRYAPVLFGQYARAAIQITQRTEFMYMQFAILISQDGCLRI